MLYLGDIINPVSLYLTDGDFEVHLVSLSCSEAPEGYAR
jgi:hypothetical protein